ncbi:TonB-dependent receptor domain-containing protein [Sphingomonas sp. NPDC092331]|uniref:TonB-dependent receptor domain-containing protein n=1 Tax=unclassified Sphingomonas TaxID=196159 RepID=UPI0031F53340
MPKSKGSLRTGVAVFAFAIGAICAAPPALAQHGITLPAASLEDSLNLLSRQSGVQILVDQNLVRGKKARPIKSVSSVEAALAQLLHGTDLTYQKRGDAFLIIRGGDAQRARKTAAGPRPKAANHGQGPALAADEGQASGDAGSGNDIVVTAQKVSERLIDVPAAVSAFTAQDLSDQKIEGGPELLRAIPNVSFSKDNFSGYNFTVRGIGTKAISVTADPAVAISFNYAPLIRNRLFEQEYFDVERVEVLRGPQGTLYGRNATAGVVNMLPAKPRLGVWGGEIQGEVGNYSTTRLRGFVNIPLGDTLAFRAAGAWTKRDGYDYNTVTQKNVNGRDLYSTRLSALWEPDPALRFSFFWEHFNENDDRARTGKQLCTRGETPQKIDYTDRNGVAQSQPVVGAWSIGALTPGCQQKTLYSDAAYGVPNGRGFPIVTALTLALAGNRGPYGSYYTPMGLDPFGTANGQQSHDLREIGTFYDPKYRARNDLFQFNAEIDLTDRLHFTGQVLYTKDYYSASQDFFRFQAVPYFIAPEQYATGVKAAWKPYLGSRNGLGTFKDPQLGELTTPAAIDRSEARSEQWAQEIRLNSSFDGPLNFNLGANYLSYETTENYYVFSNLFTIAALSEGPYCDAKGVGCAYIDPNPIDKINGEGHNYFRSIQQLKTKSWATFGEIYWKPAQNLKVTAGLRYTDDQKLIIPYATQLLSDTRGLNSGTVDRGYPADPAETMRWRRVTGRLALNWKPHLAFTDETALYASYARGYKGGGDNPRGQADKPCGPNGLPVAPALVCGTYTRLPTNFKPEELNTFEIGMKNKIAGGKILLNFSAFFNDYKNYQISQLINRAINTENLDAITYGAELEAAWIPSRHFKIGATLGYLRTRIGNGQSSIDVMDRVQGHDEWMTVNPWAQSPNTCIAPKALVAAYLKKVNPKDINSTSDSGINFFCEAPHVFGSAGNPFAPGGIGQALYGFTYSPTAPYDPSKPANYYGPNPSNYGAPNNGYGFAADLSGHELPNAPHLTFNIGAEYTVFFDDWRLSLRGDYYRQSASFARVYNTDYDRLRAWGNANLAITLSRPASDLTYQFYVKNVFNSTPITDAFTGPNEVGTFSNVFTLDPRIIGFSVRVGIK